MNKLLLIFFTTSIFMAQNSSGFSSMTSPIWIKSNSLSPLVLGRGNTGIAADFKNGINYQNTSAWSNSNLTLYDINILSNRTSIELGTETATLSGTQLGSLAWITTAMDSTLAFGVTFNSLYENSSKSSVLIFQDTDSGMVEVGDKLFENVGNINQLKIGSSYTISPKLSVGFDLLYYQGNFRFDERQQFSSGTAFESSLKLYEKLTTYNGFSYGLSLSTSILNDKLHLAATYSMKKELATDAKSVFKSGTSSALNTEENLTSTPFTVPSRFGLGLHYELSFGHLFADFKSEGETSNSEGSTYLSVGYQSNPSKQLFDSFIKRSTYTLGSYYYTENFYANGNEIVNYGISAGMAIPFNYNTKQLSLGLSYGKRGDNDKNGLSESVFKFSIGLSIGEFWYNTIEEN